MVLRPGDKIKIEMDVVEPGEETGIIEYYPKQGTIGEVLQAFLECSHTRTYIIAQVRFPEGSTEAKDDIDWVPECDMKKVEE